MGFPDADLGEGGGGIFLPVGETGGAWGVSVLALSADRLSEGGSTSDFSVALGGVCLLSGVLPGVGLGDEDFFELITCLAGVASDSLGWGGASAFFFGGFLELTAFDPALFAGAGFFSFGVFSSLGCDFVD